MRKAEDDTHKRYVIKLYASKVENLVEMGNLHRDNLPRLTEGQKTCGINAGAHESRTRDVSCFTRLPDWLNDVGISNFFPWKKAFPLFFFTDSSSIDLRNRASL